MGGGLVSRGLGVVATTGLGDVTVGTGGVVQEVDGDGDVKARLGEDQVWAIWFHLQPLTLFFLFFFFFFFFFLNIYI